MTKKKEQIDKDLARLCNTEYGISFLQWLKVRTGYQEPAVVINPQSGELNPLSMIYNNARTNLWLELREHLPQEKRILIEDPTLVEAPKQPEKQPDKNEEKEEWPTKARRKTSPLKSRQRLSQMRAQLEK